MSKSKGLYTLEQIRLRDVEVMKVYKYLESDANYTLSDTKTVIQRIFSLTRPQVSASFGRLGVKGKSIQEHTKSEKTDHYICPSCGEEKHRDEFSKKGFGRDGVTERLYSYCKQCSTSYQKPLTIKRLYNLTMEQYEALGTTCMICGRTPKADSKQKSTPVDHDHKTGLIRGRLCQRCNRGLAWFQDNIELFQSCITYLKNPPATKILGESVYGRTGRTTNKRNKKALLSKKAIQSIKDGAGVNLGNVQPAKIAKRF